MKSKKDKDYIPLLDDTPAEELKKMKAEKPVNFDSVMTAILSYNKPKKKK